VPETGRLANRMRADLLEAIAACSSGHPSGSLAVTDILAVLYGRIMRIRPVEPSWTDRDRFILAKGHAAPALYAALAGRGFFGRRELLTLRRIDSRLQGHPDMKTTPGVDMTTGSLGQGLSAGVGMALGGRIARRPARVFVLMSDAEQAEGQVWEAAMSAAHFGLSRLVAVIDRDGSQTDGPTDEVMQSEPLASKWRAFGWRVLQCDGHDHDALERSFLSASRSRKRPTVVIARTQIGRGVSFLEGRKEIYGEAFAADMCARALRELGEEPVA
jgi:transketolase